MVSAESLKVVIRHLKGIVAELEKLLASLETASPVK